MPHDKDPMIICERLKVVKFAAIHISTITTTNTIFDLVSPPSSESIIDALRQEANEVLAANNNTWTKQGLTQMYKIDSTIKESLRVRLMSAYGLLRAVVKKGGITTPYNRTYLPEGASVGIGVQAIHRGSNVYTQPDQYQPFRFADLRAAATAKVEGGTTGALKAANFAFPSVSPTFQSFGFGRHACLGRFFAANELKLLLAYIVQHYDLQMQEKRPETTWIGPVMVCPMDKTIKMKRREIIWSF